MDFLVRRIQESDIEQVQDIAKKTWNATYEGLIPLDVQEKFLSSAYNDNRMQQRMEKSLILVANTSEKVVGFANFSRVTDDGIVGLAAIYIYPEYQGRGIGSALLNQGIKELHGVKEVFVDVEKENLSGIKFYEAKAFEVVREFDDDFDGHILKTVEMVLKV
ncbi:MAG: GNAT family N-acetyltransferase [Carnobacterium alterfunditum]